MSFEEDDLLELLQEAVGDGVISCRSCGNSLEPDAKRCGECNEPNPLIALGMI